MSDAGSSFTFSTDHYNYTQKATGVLVYKKDLSITVGNRYIVSIKVKNGTYSGAYFRLMLYDGKYTLRGTRSQTTSSWVTHTYEFVARNTTTSGRVGLYVETNMGGTLNIQVKDFLAVELGDRNGAIEFEGNIATRMTLGCNVFTRLEFKSIVELF